MALMYTGAHETAIPEDDVIRDSNNPKEILNDDSDDVMAESAETLTRCDALCESASILLEAAEETAEPKAKVGILRKAADAVVDAIKKIGEFLAKIGRWFRDTALDAWRKAKAAVKKFQAERSAAKHDPAEREQPETPSAPVAKPPVAKPVEKVVVKGFCRNIYSSEELNGIAEDIDAYSQAVGNAEILAAGTEIVKKGPLSSKILDMMEGNSAYYSAFDDKKLFAKEDLVLEEAEKILSSSKPETFISNMVSAANDLSAICKRMSALIESYKKTASESEEQAEKYKRSIKVFSALSRQFRTITNIMQRAGSVHTANIMAINAAIKSGSTVESVKNESVGEELAAYGYEDSEDFVDMEDDYYIDDADDFYEDDVDGVIVSEDGHGALAVGIAAATTAAIGAISVAYSKTHRGGALSRKALKVANGKSWDTANKEVENILKSNKTFKVSESALAFSKKYEASARGDVMRIIKMVESFAEKHPITADQAMQSMGSISDENAERFISGRKEAEELLAKIDGISKHIKVKRPKAQRDYREVSSRELVAVFNKVRDVVDSASDLFYKKNNTGKVSRYSETDVSYKRARATVSHTVRTPNRLFTIYARTVARLYEAAHNAIMAYVSNSLYALRRSSNSFSDKKSISENSTAEEKLLFAKALIEDARSQAEFESLLDEAAEEMCLDEGYVKNQLKKTTIFHGKAMKAAKDLSKEAKNAAKKGNYKLAAEKQQLYVNSLKDLYEECCEIEDDTKMIAVATSVIKGLAAGLGANMIASTSFVGVPAAIKAGVNQDTMFNVAIPGATEEAKAKSAGISMEELRARNRKAYDKIAAKNKLGANIAKNIDEYKSTARGKVGIAAAAVVGLVAAIINGKRSYNKQILKYASQERDTTLEFPKSRVDAKNKMRRMIRLAESILKDYENIATVEAK